MEDEESSSKGAEDEQVAVAVFGFLDGLFNGHGPDGDGFRGAEDVGLNNGSVAGERVHGDGSARLFAWRTNDGSGVAVASGDLLRSGDGEGGALGFSWSAGTDGRVGNGDGLGQAFAGA